jgi:hypothetical protein
MAPAVSAATILSDNLSASPSGAEAATGSTWLTASFGTDASQYVLDSITLLLANPTAGNAEVDVYNDGGLQPGSLIAILAAPALFSTTPAQTTFTANGTTLSANSTYWAVLKATSGQFDWSWTSDNTGAGAGFQGAWGISTDAGATWFTYDVFPLQFSVSATPVTAATPEPGTLALSVAGGLAGAAAMFLRRKRTS